ncbi:hypothetical protein WOLCODRAFT_25322 [Wolfiporia cocos MD-104 SS10]|uniref:Uncharacterized protein n=1 Tax=Wolfiporia cocos (strain MD-104) TaxID=742152 RepID=A0A2H3JJJ7_WOLCO|nr:hypothetical protein WOLCODRAFT_25322 [Wolfiporia cocos MD-104 SS10]
MRRPRVLAILDTPDERVPEMIQILVALSVKNPAIGYRAARVSIRDGVPTAMSGRINYDSR